jgi:cytochrome c peroxidase
LQEKLNATCHFIPLFNGTVPPVIKKEQDNGTPQNKTNQDLGRFT